MRGKRFALLIGLLMMVAVATMAVAQPGVSGAPSGQVQLEFLIEMPKSSDPALTPVGDLVGIISNLGSSGEDGFRVDSFFDITYVSNLGSSGLDGFAVDSFFDVTYDIEYGSSASTIEVEIIAMQLRATPNDPANPVGAIDAVKKAVNGAGGKVYVGHVTVLK